MKKSSFIAMLLGTISGMLFALGLCMVLIPEWSAAGTGTVLGGTGMLLGAVTILIWRRMEHCRPIQISLKTLLVAAVAIAGTLVLGIGMCFSTVSYTHLGNLRRPQ